MKKILILAVMISVSTISFGQKSKALKPKGTIDNSTNNSTIVKGDADTTGKKVAGYSTSPGVVQMPKQEIDSANMVIGYLPISANRWSELQYIIESSDLTGIQIKAKKTEYLQSIMEYNKYIQSLLKKQAAKTDSTSKK